MPVLLAVGAFFLVLNLVTLWIWATVATGKRKATVVKSLWMFLSLSTVTAVLGLGVTGADGYPFLWFLSAFLWPLVLVDSVPRIIEANLNVFVITVAVVCGITAYLFLKSRGRARIAILVSGAIAAVFVPVTLQNMQIQWQMNNTAEAAGLEIVEKASLFYSIRERSDAYTPPHGIACDAEGWPHLWSYRERDWIALPLETGFGGDTPKQVRRTLCSWRQS